jgi:membrane protein implicated in regulation of membrane protease activity
MSFLSCPWLWLYCAAFLILLELFAPGFVIFFFGLSAATVGLLRFIFGETLTLTWQLTAFSAFSVIYLVFLRRWCRRLFAGKIASSAEEGFDSGLVGRCGRVVEPVAPPSTGRVLVGDSEWTAASDRALAAGSEVKIVAQTNLTLTVEPV